jgi:predicted Zn-dependent peptidase
MVNNAPFNYDTPKKRLSNATSEYLTNFPRGFYKDLATNIAKVSYDQVNPAIKGFFRPEELTLTVVGDAKRLQLLLSKLPGFSAPVVRSYLED